MTGTFIDKHGIERRINPANVQRWKVQVQEPQLGTPWDSSTWWIRPAEEMLPSPENDWIAETIDESEQHEFGSSREAREYVDDRIKNSGHAHGTEKARWWPGQTLLGMSSRYIASLSDEEVAQYRREYFNESGARMRPHPDSVDLLVERARAAQD